MKQLLRQSKIVQNNLLRLLISPHFLIITFLGNGIIIAFSYLVYVIEKNAGGNISSFLEAVWWGFSTATTVGYGDFTPVTTVGRIIGIVLMLMGTALFATYTALFARAVLGYEFQQIHMLEKRDITTNEAIYNLKKQLKELQKNLEEITEDIENKE